MSERQNKNPFDLLGQANDAPPAVHLRGAGEPQFEISWGAFRQSFSSSLSGAFERSIESRKFMTASFFKDAWVEKRFPRRAVAAAALWHLVLFVIPKPDLVGQRHFSQFDNTVLNQIPPFTEIQPTSENVAAVIYHDLVQALAGHPVAVRSVCVWETPTNYVVYSEAEGEG